MPQQPQEVSQPGKQAKPDKWSKHRTEIVLGVTIAVLSGVVGAMWSRLTTSIEDVLDTYDAERVAMAMLQDADLKSVFQEAIRREQEEQLSGVTQRLKNVEKVIEDPVKGDVVFVNEKGETEIILGTDYDLSGMMFLNPSKGEGGEVNQRLYVGLDESGEPVIWRTTRDGAKEYAAWSDAEQPQR